MAKLIKSSSLDFEYRARPGLGRRTLWYEKYKSPGCSTLYVVTTSLPAGEAFEWEPNTKKFRDAEAAQAERLRVQKQWESEGWTVVKPERVET